MQTKQTLIASAVALTFHAGMPAQAGDADDIATIRQEIAAMRQSYETRIAALEARLKQAEARPAAAKISHDTAATPPRANAGGFNPEVSLILSGEYARRDDRPERAITGFMPAGDSHGGERGFNLRHTELVISANIDPYFRGYAAFDLADATLEEAWLESMSLGNGLSLKGGRFFSGLGYINERHPHAWDFADTPLIYQALFGERFRQDGLQLKWLAPTETYLAFGLETGSGGNLPGVSGSTGGIGAWSGFAKIGGDVGGSNSWRAGLAYLSANPKARSGHWQDANGDEVATAFTGDTRAWVADVIWKWAPQGNPKERNLSLQAEYFQRDEKGALACSSAGTLCAAEPSDRYSARQSGWYAQGVYQFMPRWRTGLRYERLDSGELDFGGLAVDTPNYRPDKYSLMVDYSPSEFSRIRLQFARDHSMQGLGENQITLQYVMSLGAHGAHKF